MTTKTQPKTRTLTNSFHCTECKTRFSDAELEQIEMTAFTGRGEELAKAKRQIRGIWKQLCGIKECTCGDTFGRRA